VKEEEELDKKMEQKEKEKEENIKSGEKIEEEKRSLIIFVFSSFIYNKKFFIDSLQ
jgi:hypothetical protein